MGVVWLFRTFVAAIILVMLAAVLTPQGRTAFRATLSVLQVLEQPIKPQSWFSADPLREAAAYGSLAGSDVADICCLPDGEPRAAVLLSQ